MLSHISIKPLILYNLSIKLNKCVFFGITGPVEGEARRRQVRDLCGLRGAQRLLQVGMVPVDQDLRGGRALTGKKRKECQVKKLGKKTSLKLS